MNIVPFGFITRIHSFIHSLHQATYSPSSLLSMLLPKSLPILYGGSTIIISQDSLGSFLNSISASPSIILFKGNFLYVIFSLIGTDIIVVSVGANAISLIALK